LVEKKRGKGDFKRKGGGERQRKNAFYVGRQAILFCAIKILVNLAGKKKRGDLAKKEKKKRRKEAKRYQVSRSIRNFITYRATGRGEKKRRERENYKRENERGKMATRLVTI